MIQKQLFNIDMNRFKLGEFSVILGMDWLTRYEAQLNCRHKRVSLEGDSGRIIFRGQKQDKKFFTMIRVKKLLRQGCQAYLAHVIDTKKQIPKIEEILVVNEYKEFIPDELQGFSLRSGN